jgi:polyisoprenoid-binding protein YceI
VPRIRQTILIILFAAATVLAACRAPPPAPAAPSSREVPAPSVDRRGATEFRVVPERSLLTVLVFRAGPLARLGHNHVIAWRDLTGEVYLTPDRAHSAFELRIPVAQLSVDEPALRAAEGADFAEAVAEDAKAGTRRNMLSAALLDGDRYPAITLRSAAILSTANEYRLSVAVTLKAQTRRITVPVRFSDAGEEIIVTGETRLSQTALGLQPFSVMLGALQVEDELQVRFRVTARRAAAATP